MAYPTLANWIRFKRVSKDEYLFIDLLHDTKKKADAYTVWFARQLNGKRNPYKIDREVSRRDVNELLDKLKDDDIIRDKRFLSKNFLQLLLSVWKPHITINVRIFSFIVNGLLLISWLPLLAFSIFYFFNNLYDLSADYIILGSFVGLFIGMVMHELGHMCGCLAYGGRVFEIGIGIQFLLPCAYVLMNESHIKTRMKRIQVSAAGIEMNFLLTAIFLMLSARFVSLSGFFLGASIQNAFLALLNLTFIDGFDGAAIMSELLGVDSLIEKAKKVTKSKLRRKRLKRNGISGMITIVACFILRSVQVALPIVLILNILGGFSWT